MTENHCRKNLFSDFLSVKEKHVWEVREKVMHGAYVRGTLHFDICSVYCGFSHSLKTCCEDDEDCEHSFLLKDDLGYVCRICGVIERRIETIIDVQFNKAKKSTRTYASDYRSGKDRDSSDMVGVKLSEDDLVVTDIAAHPRHKKQMKPHQVEGFNFLRRDFLDELPGLVDFTVLLNPTPKQKIEGQKLKKFSRKFKICAAESAVFLHPMLSSLFENSVPTDDKMDELLEKLDVRDGVKAKFFLNMLNLCESSGERLLVFSQYLLPLKFLERLSVKVKNWSPGREIFVISGESSAEHLTRQAIGRAFQPGQKKKVYAYRLVTAGFHEGEDHTTCFKKELILRMWLEWNEYCGYQNFQVETMDANTVVTSSWKVRS
ncbi:hypothetical protein Ddye_014578 [Dipteronia dyeriana]|uniref:Uncharacterized protein n=1 Tax=Dipteronia dyeriana TaxID=168575 RepID=A0AAD9X8J2_9ROSI|nr:hypothetical protein Ddye_014578 [Dipteronia dyeriana]